MNRRNFLSAVGAGVAGSIALPNAVHAITATEPDDISLVREILSAIHPGLYRYNSPTAMGASVDRLAKQWTAQPDLAARYLNLSRFLATIKCGHSYANFFNQTSAVKQQLFDRGSRLPFAFKWIGNKMVVLQDQSGTASLPRGTIIEAINDVPTGAMLDRLMPYVRADGNNEAKRRALLSMTGADEFETFDIFHGLLYRPPGSKRGESKRGEHRLRARLPNSSSVVRIDLPTLTLAQRQSFIKTASNRGDGPVWDWTMREDGIAVLRMDGWALFNSKWDWKSWLNDRLDSLAGAKGLIVDIRENEGGLDCGDLILSRSTAKDIVMPSAKRLVRYRTTPDHLNRYLDTWDNSFRNWGNDAEPFDERYYRLKRDDGGIIPAKGPRVDVPMAVLTSAQNSSATFQFAGLCKATRLGTLVGETTGGNQRGINGGAFFFARLPESGIEFDVPLIGYFPDEPKPDAGIEPDIPIGMSANEIASGEDPQLAAAVTHLLGK
jgi:Peptidase family S41